MLMGLQHFETEHNDGKVFIHTECLECGAKKVIIIAEKQYIALYARNAHIQDIIPEVAIQDRELLISGICGPCFDRLVSEDD